MTGLTTVPREVEEYLAAVRESLGDLPAAERDDLLAEVEASLADAAADTGAPLTARLGPPGEFAAELRSAAGLHEPSAAKREPSRLVLHARALGQRLSGVRRVASELAPIWWVVRACVLVGALAFAVGATWSTRYPVVPRIGSYELGLALIALAIVLSIYLGLWARRRGSPFPRVGLVLNAALVVAAIPVALGVVARAQDTFVRVADSPATIQEPLHGLTYDGVPVTNIYPYSRDGKLLHDVLLYDGSGRPLELPTDRALDPDRRIVVTNGNRPLFNAFPIRYYEPGTRKVARPNAAPFVELPLVLTPPLERGGEPTSDDEP